MSGKGRERLVLGGEGELVWNCGRRMVRRCRCWTFRWHTSDLMNGRRTLGLIFSVAAVNTGKQSRQAVVIHMKHAPWQKTMPARMRKRQ